MGKVYISNSQWKKLAKLDKMFYWRENGNITYRRAFNCISFRSELGATKIALTVPHKLKSQTFYSSNSLICNNPSQQHHISLSHTIKSNIRKTFNRLHDGVWTVSARDRFRYVQPFFVLHKAWNDYISKSLRLVIETGTILKKPLHPYLVFDSESALQASQDPK